MSDEAISERSLSKKRWRAPAALIRLSAVLFAGLMIGHMSAYPWTSTHVASQIGLVERMRSVPFEFMGERSTYWNLYFGWGLLVGVLLLTLAVTLWLLSNLVQFHPRSVGAIAGAFSVASAVGACLAWRFFYVPPFIFFLLIAFILAISSAQLLRDRSRQVEGVER